jgi:hypothetical protein
MYQCAISCLQGRICYWHGIQRHGLRHDPKAVSFGTLHSTSASAPLMRSMGPFERSRPTNGLRLLVLVCLKQLLQASRCGDVRGSSGCSSFLHSHQKHCLTMEGSTRQAPRTGVVWRTCPELSSNARLEEGVHTSASSLQRKPESRREQGQATNNMPCSHAGPGGSCVGRVGVCKQAAAHQQRRGSSGEHHRLPRDLACMSGGLQQQVTTTHSKAHRIVLPNTACCEVVAVVSYHFQYTMLTKKGL